MSAAGIKQTRSLLSALLKAPTHIVGIVVELPHQPKCRGGDLESAGLLRLKELKASPSETNLAGWFRSLRDQTCLNRRLHGSSTSRGGQAVKCERPVLLIIVVGNWLAFGASNETAASTIFNVDFNQMTVGSPPATGQPMIEPSAWFALSPTTCQVQQQFGDLPDKPLVFFDPSIAAAAKVLFNLPEPMIQGTISVAWECAAGQIARGGEMTLYGSGGVVIWMRYDLSGQIYVSHGDGSGHETSSLVGAYSVGEANQFQLSVDMGAGHFSLSIDGMAVLVDRALLNPGAPLESLMFGTETSEPDAPRASNSYGFDNVVIEASPISDVPGDARIPARLYQNRPNPFNPLTTLRFDLPSEGPARLMIYDVAGRLIRTLLDGDMSSGRHEAVWDGRDTQGRGLASGTYLARLEFDGKTETVRMGLVR